MVRCLTYGDSLGGYGHTRPTLIILFIPSALLRWHSHTCGDSGLVRRLA